MIEKTQAIVLRFSPYSNTSRVVTWLTPDWGKITTIIKGSQRPKSAFLGQYDLFYTCELLFYVNEKNHVHIAKECAPLKTRNHLRADWKAAACASYFADLFARLSPPDAPHGGLFPLLDSTLDHLDAHGASIPFLFWFELKTLDVLGLSPRLTHCLECDTELGKGKHNARFSSSRGGIVCGRCVGKTPESGIPIAPDILAMLSHWQKTSTPHAAVKTQCTGRQIDELKNLLGLFLNYHLETTLASRSIALDILERKDATARIGKPNKS